MKKSTREQGNEVEDIVNEVLGTKPTPNSGGTDRGGNSLGYDHMHAGFVGESKDKPNKKTPNITSSELAKLKRIAQREGYKDWFFVVRYNDGKDIAITLDLHAFAEISNQFWFPPKENNTDE